MGSTEIAYVGVDVSSSALAVGVLPSGEVWESPNDSKKASPVLRVPSV